MLLLRLKNIYTSCFWLLLTFLLVAGGGNTVKGQLRTYAGILGLSPGTTNAGNAILTNETFATSTGSAGFGTSSIQLLFANTTNVVPANTIVFVKINTIGSVGVTVQTGATSTTAGTDVATTMNVLFSPDGTNLYAAVTAAVPFNAVKVTVTGALLGSNSVRTYYAFYNQNNPLDCGTGMAAGKAVNAVLAIGADVTDPLNAIDNDPTLSTAAFLTLGTLAVAGTVSENVYFSGPSTTGDAVRATFSIPPSLLNVGLLGNISIQAYSGNTPIGTPQSLASVLSLDLLGLLGSNAKYTFYFVPGQTFDRVEFVVGGVVSLLGGLNLYDVQRVPSPLIAGASPLSEVNACGTTATVSIAAPLAGITYQWYNTASGGAVLGTGTSFHVTGLTPGTTSIYYVEAIKPGCTNALRHPVQIKSLALPTVGPITGNTNICLNQTTTLSSTSTGGVWSSSDPLIATINSSTGVVTTVSSGSSTIIYTYTDPATTCSNSVQATLTVKPLPALSSNLSPVVCSGSVFNYTATSNLGGTTFNWNRAVVSGISNSAGSGLTSSINETLINTTNSAITVTYVFNLTADGCSNVINVQLKVNPKPGIPHILSQ